MGSTDRLNSRKLIGLEFLGLTHWDRYILNENIAKLEKKVFPSESPPQEYDENELWRGNRRKYYRLNIQSLDLYVELDFRPSRLACLKAKIINLSPEGSQLLLPSGGELEKNTQIPRVKMKFRDQEVKMRARVTYISSLPEASPH